MNFGRKGIQLTAAALACVCGTVLSVSAGDEPAAPAGGGAVPAAPTPETVDLDAAVSAQKLVAVPSPAPVSKGCIADNLAIDDIRKRREEIDVRARELTAKESELRAREAAIEDELKKIQEVRDQIAQAEGAAKKQNEEKVSKLVETFETMSPKTASQLLGSIDETLAVTAMARISTLRLAKIINLMEPAKSTRLTELLAGVTRAKKHSTSVPHNDVAAVTQANSLGSSNQKGGDKNDEYKQQNAVNAPEHSDRREPASKAGSEKGR